MPKSPEKNLNNTLSIGLAPMHGVTDFAFRLWFYLISSCETMTTPFLRVTESYPHKVPADWAPDVFDHDVKKKLKFKTTLQMMASCPKRFIDAYSMFADHLSEVELNCGCPSPKVVSHAAGSSLLRDVSYFRDFISKISSEIGASNFCVKIRTGYSHDKNFTDLICALKDQGIKRLTVHGRTKEQKYMGCSRMDLIHEASLLCPFPVIASGDIFDRKSYELALKKMPQIQGLIIGRGALKNPFVFCEIKDKDFKLENYKFLFYAFACYGLFIEILRDNFDEIRTMILKGLFDEPYLNDEKKWKTLLGHLYRAFYGKEYFEKAPIELLTPTLGRLKLLWGNILQGLLEGKEGRSLLREKSSKGFFNKLWEQF